MIQLSIKTYSIHAVESVGRDEVRTSGSCSQPSTTIIQQASSDCSAVGPVSQLERKDAEIEWQSFWQEGSLSDVMSALGRAFSAEYKLECLQLVRSIKIYKGLVAYVYAQQRIENGKPDIFESIRQALSEWESWDDPECLSGHAIIRNKLWIILQEGSSHQKPASQDIDLQKIIDFDLETMRIKAMVILTDRREKKIFLSLCCTNPIPAMDLLQILLDTPNLPMQSHSQLAWALSRLAKMSGCYPNGLILGDIRRTETHPIAGGGFADVWKGSFIEQPVALKAFRIFQKSPQEKALNEFAREAVIWRQLRHPNILPFYGVFKGDEHFDRLCLVSPWMDEGNVMEYLSKHVESNRISLLRDVASGLEYLHGFEPAIVHGDLKGANIFFTSSNVACLGDFGLARFRDSQESSFSATTGNSVAGTLRWQAPELFVSRENGEHIHATPESDIYSFGCVCIEILTGKRPFAEISNDAAVMLAVVNKRKPQRPDEDLLRCGLDDSLWETMERCWDINPYLRPPTHRLVKYFEQRKDLGPRGNDTCEHAEIPNALRCSLGQYGFPDDYVDSVSARQVLI
ncbi:kinase-like protein [Rickenella mellea]|uniref:Kinase-like protein n=1 Tax=Rickenella mellea TaxID=50990 RepID=A0A4Y7QAA9_9AGAM|nr:kinase-like protein [Rickenella mellea]